MVPPAWTGPAVALPSEGSAAKSRRERDAPLWDEVPRLTDQEERKKLLKKNAFKVNSKGQGAGSSVTMPSTLDTKDLETLLSKKKDPQSASLLRIVKTDWPAVVNRESDVFRALLTMLNSWSTRSNEQNQAKISEVILPLVIDNNIKATESMSRLSIELLYPDVKITDETNSAPKVSVTHTTDATTPRQVW